MSTGDGMESHVMKRKNGKESGAKEEILFFGSSIALKRDPLLHREKCC
jgi:hypothetical protein